MSGGVAAKAAACIEFKRMLIREMEVIRVNYEVEEGQMMYGMRLHEAR